MAEAAPQGNKLNVFISYSRDDLWFSDQLDMALGLTGFDTTLDRHGISGGEDWKSRLGNLLRDADTVAFVLSPSSARSEICAWEVGEAIRLGKRIIPVLCRPLDGASPPAQLADLNYIFFYEEPKSPGSGFGSGLVRLVAALNTDLDWLHEHTRYLQRASEWDAGGRPANRLLSGADIASAKTWAASRPKAAPEPTALQLDFIRASETEESRQQSAEAQRLRQLAEAQAEREAAFGEKAAAQEREADARRSEAESQKREAEQARRTVNRTRAGLAAALLLAVTAGWFGYNAMRERDRAQSARIAEQISHAETAFETSPTLGLLLAVEALKLSRNNQLLECSKQLCVEFAADKLVTMLSKTGGTPLIGSSGPISDVSFSPDGKLLATADDQAVYLWRRDQLKSPLAKLKLPYSGKGTAVSFSPDGRLLATAAFGAVLLWRIDEPQQPFYTFPPIEFSNMGYTSALFSSNGKLVLTASGGGVRIWQLDQLKPGAKPIAELPAYVPSGRIIAASFISDDESIVTASDAGKVLQWRLDRLDKPVQLADLKMRLETASFGRDGKTVVIPRQLDTLDRENAAHFVNLSEASTWEDKPPLVNKQFYARAVTLSVDDKLVAAADDSGLVRVWGIDGETKEPEGLRGHQGPVYAASFSRDGKFILTGGADKSARLWHVDRRRAIAPADQSQNWTTRLEELIQLAGKTAGRNLTTEEWSNSFPDADYQPTFKDLPTPATEKQD
jgi:WD40 repeat protein